EVLNNEPRARSIVTSCRPANHKRKQYWSKLHSCRPIRNILERHWFEDGLIAQVQVSRNHVSGYRVETVIFGEEGQIHVGRFEQKPLEIVVEAYGRRGRAKPIAYQTFSMRDYDRPLPEFVDRFGAAYKAELAAFIECCRTSAPV